MEQFISTEAASNFRVTASGNEKIKKTVMIVDDDLEIQQLLKSFYADLDFNLQIFSDPLQALTHLQPKPVKRIVVCETVDLIICDLKMPRMDGLEFMDRLREANLQIPVIMITGHASKETAIEALHKGAFDYITKPINFLELGVLSRRAIKLRSLEEDYHALKKVLVRSWRMDEILGKSPKMQQLFDLIGRVAAFPSNVLITGESGTGKEMVARTIHAQSSRAEKPFIAVNCSAIPENLLESELFGHVRGSFTGATGDRRGLFEEANGGTIFLDEIGDMPLSLQTKLLRVIQERKIRPVGDNKLREIDVRVIAATHKNLKLAIKNKEFREDLYYRLCVVPIELPPLRDRKEDVPLLAEHFLQKYAALSGANVSGFTKLAMSKLLGFSWRGNVRELENTIERAVVLCRSSTIDEAEIQVEAPETTISKLDQFFSDLISLEEMEKRYIEYVLINTGNKKEEAADILRVNRKTLYRKIKEYNINLPKKSEL